MGDLSVRQHVIWRVSVRPHKTPSSFDRSIDTSMMGGKWKRLLFFFFLNICIFIKKKSREKETYFDIICRFFSLKRGDFSEDARLLTPRRRFFRSFSSKNFHRQG